jgi:hypothetical protein
LGHECIHAPKLRGQPSVRRDVDQDSPFPPREVAQCRVLR